MGDAYEDVITEEERAVQMGEAQPAPVAETAEPEKEPESEATIPTELAVKPPEEEPETEQKEPTTEQIAAVEETEGFRIETDEKTGKHYIVDDDGTRVPPQRFGKIFREAQEGKRTQDKLDLFKKLGPEGYYDIYPDEKPEGWKAETKTETVKQNADLGSLVVTQPDGPYDGMTLREVYDVDPVFANQLQTDYLWNQKQEEARKVGELDRVRQESAKELESFVNSVAKDLFGKEMKDITEKEEAEISKTIETVTQWMRKTHRGGGIIADAYFLMNKEGLLKKASETAARRTLQSLQTRKGPMSIDTARGGEPKTNGFELVEKMTERQLEDHIDTLNDAAMQKFLKDAPENIRTKFPSMPWK